MTKNNSDQFAKQLLEEVLAPFGTVETSHEVSGEPQWVDVFFVPAHPSLTSELGLLGRIAQQSCLIEPFRNQPTDDEVRSCLLKLFQVHGNFLRQSRREEESIPPDNLPFLWILNFFCFRKSVARIWSDRSRGLASRSLFLAARV